MKGLETADTQCVKELYTVYEKWRLKVLKDLKELDNINLTFNNASQNGEHPSDFTILAKTDKFNEFLKRTTLKEELHSKSQLSQGQSQKQNQPGKIPL